MRVVWTNNLGKDTSSRVYRYVRERPNWVTRTALTVFALVLMLPIIAFVIFALALGAIVFLSLAAFSAITRGLRAGLGHDRSHGGTTGSDDEGRDNVRVISRD